MLQALKTKTPTVEIVTIDGNMAKSLLSGNKKNRSLSKKTVDKYAAALKKQEWQLNGETIKIAPDGRIIDGQHRLNAILQSGVPMTTYVAYDIPEACFYTIDTGKNRSGSDILKINGVEKYTTMKAATLRIIDGLNSGLNTQKASRFHTISSAKLLDVYSDLPAFDEDLNQAGKLKNAVSLFGAASVGVLYYMAGRKNSEQRDLFFRSLNSGENLMSGSPILAARNKIVNSKIADEPLTPAEKLNLLISAWNNYRKDNSVSYLKYSKPYCLIDII